jgi:hypothetical protein
VIVSILIIFGVVFSIALFIGFMLSNVGYYDAVVAFVENDAHVHYSESLETVATANECWFCNRIAQYPGQFTFLLMLTVEYYWYFILPAGIALIAGIAFLLIPTDKKSEEATEEAAIAANASAVEEAPTVEADPAADPVAELKRYKELLDNNIITQEEFEAKKKQLLGI